MLAIIQARDSSTRLRGKATIKLEGRPIVDHVITRCRVFADFVAVAIPHTGPDERLHSYLLQSKADYVMRGPVDDVFSRFVMVLKELQYDGEWFYRVTADCPFLDPRLARFLAMNTDDRYDYIAPDLSTIVGGTGCELVRTKAFLALQDVDLTDYEREHVTPYFYQRVPERSLFLKLSLELNTPNDYVRITRVSTGKP